MSMKESQDQVNIHRETNMKFNGINGYRIYNHDGIPTRLIRVINLKCPSCGYSRDYTQGHVRNHRVKCKECKK